MKMSLISLERGDQTKKKGDQCEDSLRVVKVVLGRGLSQSSCWRWELVVPL